MYRWVIKSGFELILYLETPPDDVLKDPGLGLTERSCSDNLTVNLLNIWIVSYKLQLMNWHII